MTGHKSKFFPIIITVLVIIIIIYLFATIKQPYVECQRSSTDDLGIKIVEELNVNLEGNKLAKMELDKTIILPDKYLTDEVYMDSIRYSLEKSYEYLGKGKVKFLTLPDRLVAKVVVKNGETIILNNIEFLDEDDLQIKINPNTKSSDVVTLKIGDNYTEGELKSRMKNNGYACS